MQIHFTGLDNDFEEVDRWHNPQSIEGGCLGMDIPNRRENPTLQLFGMPRIKSRSKA